MSAEPSTDEAAELAAALDQDKVYRGPFALDAADYWHLTHGFNDAIRRKWLTEAEQLLAEIIREIESARLPRPILWRLERRLPQLRKTFDKLVEEFLA